MHFESSEPCFLLLIILLLCNFLYSPMIPCTLSKQLAHAVIQLFSEIKIFWPTTKNFLLKFLKAGYMPWNYQSAGSPTNKNFQNMTAWLYNSEQNVYQKIYLPNDFRLRIFGRKKILEKSQIGWGQMLVPSLPSRNKLLVIAVKNYTEVDFKVS